MRELSLFTGAGGGLLGSMLLGWSTVAAVESDPYCQRLLCARGGYVADAGYGPESERARETRREGSERASVWSIAGDGRAFPVYPDVRTFHPVPGSCDIVTGGFPCQPHSQAGKRLGGLDSRDLWPDTLRILRESHAPLGFFENVPGLLTSRDADGRSMFGGILGDLSEAGFDAEWCVLGADDVGAPHRRKRLWILAHSPSNLRRASRHDGRVAPDGAGDRGELADAEGNAIGPGLREDESRGQWRGRPGDTGSPWWCDPADVGHADKPGPQGHRDDGERAGERAAGAAGAERQRAVCAGVAQSRLGGLPDVVAHRLGGRIPRVAVGVPERVNRLRALGNGQVPLSMAAAFTLLARRAGVT